MGSLEQQNKMSGAAVAALMYQKQCKRIRETTETPPPPTTLQVAPKSEHDENIVDHRSRVMEHMFMSTQHSSTRLYRLFEMKKKKKNPPKKKKKKKKKKKIKKKS